MDMERPRSQRQSRQQARRPGRRAFAPFLAGALCATALCLGALVATPIVTKLGNLLSKQPASPAADGPDPQGIFGQHARQAGLDERCTRLMSGLGGALVGQGRHSAVSRWDKARPTRHSVQSFVGMDLGSQVQQPAGGVIFIAPVGSGCEGMLVRILPAAVPCAQMGEFLPEGSRQSADLSGTRLHDLADGATALLIPSSQGCVMVTSVSARS